MPPPRRAAIVVAWNAFLVELRDVDGDYRDWDAITTWATEIADDLTEDR